MTDMGFRWTMPSGAPSRARVLQLAGTALLAWAWYQYESGTGNSVFDLLQPPTVVAPNPLTKAAGQATQQTAAAAMPAILGATTIEVIVSHNDTLDRIF